MDQQEPARPDRELSVVDVMQITNMSRGRVLREIHAGRLAAWREINRRGSKWRVWESHLIAYQAREKAKRQPAPGRPGRGRRRTSPTPV
jgi:hypothetical protein